jgi:DNA invertase Pin-like site-specific DNA recombinase
MGTVTLSSDTVTVLVVRLRAIGYIRVSSQTQIDGYGLTSQEQDVRRCAKAHGLKLLDVLRDEGVSGSTEAIERPGLAEALALLEAGQCEVLLVPRLDRLARKLTIQEAALAQVWKHGGRVIACDQGEVERDEPDDPMRTAMRQMMGVFAQLERGMVVARLRRGRQAKKDADGYAQGRPPYGYKAEGGALIKVAVEQEVIEKARRLRVTGSSLREIARALEAEGYRTRIGGTWHPPQVSRLLEEGKREMRKT